MMPIRNARLTMISSRDGVFTEVNRHINWTGKCYGLSEEEWVLGRTAASY